ncbi:MAG: hypothetical protein AB7T63_13275 [Planctomycetota bacterium]
MPVRHLLSLVLVGLLASPALARGAGGRIGGGGAPQPDPGGRADRGLPGGAPPSAGGGLGGGFDREARREHLGPTQPEAASGGPSAPTPRGLRREGSDADEPSAPSGPPAIVHARRGEVHFVADLARVDLTLSIRNISPQTLEWRRAYRIDPAAEVVGAVLRRNDAAPIIARTLTLADARRIYDEARTPRRPRTPRPTINRDPLRLERPRRTELSVVVWPIAPGETVDVVLTFVSPLRGQGEERRFVDVLEGDPGAGERVRDTDDGSEHPRPWEGGILASAQWDMHPGQLVLATVPSGMEVEKGQDGLLVIRSGEGRPIGERPEIGFRSSNTQEMQVATAVPGGGLDKRIAIWRFDPAAYLTRKGFTLRPDLTLRLRPLSGGVDRMAPRWFGATDLARPVTVRLDPQAPKTLEYEVEIVDRTGTVLETVTESIAIRRTRTDAHLEAAIGGWHRAMLAGRVLEGARLGADPAAMQRAVAFAVDQGVLLPGSAALALPARERRALSAASRALYDRDGVPLGAPRREADLKPVPRDLLDK